MGESVRAPDIYEDAIVLRNMIQLSSEHLKKSLPKTDADKIPLKGGVQVLPVQWRKQISSPASKGDTGDNEDVPILADIALPGIPIIRTLISDLILDVLLYMTPKYREEIIMKITAECNRLVALYKKNNPDFKGKISIYGF